MSGDELPLYLVEMVVWDASISAAITLRYANKPFITRPQDVPANTDFDPRIRQPVVITRDMFTTGATMGRSRVGYGDLILLNGDGALDVLLTYGIDGRRVTVWRSTVRTPVFPQDFTASIFTMEQPEFNADYSVTIKIRDRQAELDIPLQTTKYAGANALPNGLEGVATDLKGKPKPVCYGLVKNIPAPCVNTSKLIYQVNDAAVDTVDAVYDRGVLLTAGGTYATQADLLDNTMAPAAGAYKVYAPGGYFRLGASPAGLVTADVTQGASAAERTAAQIFSQLITKASTANVFGNVQVNSTRVTDIGDTRVTDTGVIRIAQADWQNSDLLALDAANSAVLGYWQSEETTIADAIDEVARTVGAWWGADRYGVYRIKQFTAPTTAEIALSLGANDIKGGALRRVPVADETSGIPIYRQTINWGRNYAVQSTDLAASVTDARRAYLAQEWRQAIATDAAIQQIHLLAPELIDNSLFAFEADALTEAARRLALRKARRDRFELTVPLDDVTDLVDLGWVVELVHPRFGLSTIGSTAGKPFRVLGVYPNAKNREVTLNVWGSSTGLDNRVTQDGIFRVTDTGDYRITQVA